MTNNTKRGDETEERVCNILRKFKYYAHNCKKGKSGEQPVDIFAFRNKTIRLIDAKRVRNSQISFEFRRIEDNQKTSMDFAKNFAEVDSSKFGFAIEFDRDETIYWLPYEKFLEMAKNGFKSVNKKELMTLEKELDNENYN